MIKLRTKHAGKIYYTVGGAAKVLRTNAVKVKELMVQGELHWENFRVNGRIYISETSIIAYLKKNGLYNHNADEHFGN
jgi:hypothetical protein